MHSFKKIHLLSLIIFLAIHANAQMLVTPATAPPFTPINLIDQVFLGDGVEVLNVSFTGDNSAIGHFTNGQNIIGIQEGIVMTTGDVSFLNSTTNTGGGTGTANNGSSDPDLVTISGFNINDAAIYNITFVPSADTLRFDYVFASEEYPDFVCSINDVFGFFISGPGLTGPYQNMATNIALVPGTNTPVGVNTINGGNAFPTPGCIVTNTQYYINNNVPNAPFPFEYDGFTTVLTATAIVNPCDTYQIKLAIGDASDQILDSGVFLAANSFGTSGLTVSTETPNFTNTIGEGCESAEVIFRLDQPADGNYPLTYTVGGNAVMGVDYDTIPLTGIIPIGQDSFALKITAIDDGVNEGTDTIAFYVNVNACLSDTFLVFIADAEIKNASIADQTICYGDTADYDATLPMTISNGVSLSNTTNINFNHNSPASSPISVSGIPLKAYLEGAIDSVCVNILHPNDADIDIFLVGSSGKFIELSTDNGGTGDNYTNTCFVLDTTFKIQNGTAPFTGDYFPEGSWSDLDGETINSSWTLVVSDDAAGNNGTLLDWSIHFAPIYNLTYQWSPTDSVTCTNCPETGLHPDSTTQYFVKVTDTYGCITEDSATVTVIPQIEKPTGNCANVTSNSMSINWSAIPNSVGYEINIDNTGWITLNNSTFNYNINNLAEGQTVLVQLRTLDALCPPSAIDTVQCATLVCTMAANLGNLNNVSCNNGNDGSATINVTNPIGAITYTLNNTTTQVSNTFNNLSAGNYQVVIQDAANCLDTVDFIITEPSVLVIDSMTNTPLLCNNDNSGTATVYVSGGTPNYTYNWNSNPTQTNATATNLSAGTISVTVTDANSCTVSSSTTLTQPSPITTTFTKTDASCNGFSDGQAVVTASGGTAPYLYNWNNTQTTDTISNLIAGTYTVTVTDANNCTFISSVTITQPNALSISTSSTPAVCFDSNDGTGTATVNGGSAPYTYFWDTATVGITSATISTLGRGNHTVTVTDANGCSISSSVIVGSPSQIVPIVGENPASCFGVYDGSVTVTAAGGVNSYSYAWNTTPNITTDSAITNLFSGYYFVTVTDGVGCTAIDTAFIAGPVILSATKDSIPVTCYGGSDGSVMVTATGGTGAGTYTYTWNNDPNLNTATLTNVTAGTYSVYTADANGCARIDSMVVETPDEFLANLSSTPVSCNNFSDGTVTAAPTGGTSGYILNWFNNSPSSSVSGLITGFYEITVTDANNCVIFDTVEVVEPDLLVLATDTLPTSCYGLSDGSAWVTHTGGNTNFTYNWNTSPAQTTDSISGLATGNYQVIVTDDKGCQDSSAVFIRQPDTLTVSLTEIPVQCFDSSDGGAIAIPSGGNYGYNYVWSVPQTNDTVTGLPIGNYQVTVTDKRNCQTTSDINITQPPIITLGLNQIPTSCFQGNDGQAIVQVVGGTPDSTGSYQFEWNSSPPQFDSIATSLTATQFYTVTVTDANNCPMMDSIQIGQPPQLTTTATFTPVICHNENNGTATVMPTGGTYPYVYQWNTNPVQTDSMAINLTAGTYFVTVTDANNCVTETSVTVTQPNPIDIALDSINVRCYGFNDGKAWVTLTGGIAPYNYAWSGGMGQITDTLFNAIAGFYRLNITDSNDCADSAFVNITQPDTLAISFTPDSVDCFNGNDGNILATITGGVLDYNYQWSNTGLDTNFNNNLIAGLYTLSVTDDNNCTTIDSIEIFEPAPLTLNLNMRPPTCYGLSDGWANVAASGGTLPYSYQWNTNENTTQINNLLGGLYYTVTVTDGNNCSIIDSILVVNPDTLILNMTSTDEACQSGGNGTATANLSGGFEPYVYIWDANTGNQNTQTASNLATGTYSVTVTDTLGCTAQSTVFVDLASGITADISPIEVLCKGDATGRAIVSATGGTGNYNYNWDANANNQDSITATNLTAGTYTVTITDNIGCEEIASIFIDEPDEFLDIDFDSVKAVTCFGDQDGYIRIQGIGGTPNYRYSLNDGNFSNTTAWSGLASGSYLITIKDANGCLFSDLIGINQPPKFSVDLGDDVTIAPEDSFTVHPIFNNGILPFNYVWQPVDSTIMSCFDCPNPTWTGLFNTTVFTLLATDSTGCTTEDEIIITIQKSLDIYVATGFTPNNDLVNDKLFVQGSSDIQVLQFSVFDRWGERVFEAQDFTANDPIFGWDGTFQGQPLNTGVFGWVADVEFPDGTRLRFRGNTTLVR